MLLIRERIVVALPSGHKAAQKRSVALRDLGGELFLIPSKDLFPSLHQLIVHAFAQNHVPLNRYQMVDISKLRALSHRPVSDSRSFPLRRKALLPRVSFYVLRAFRFHRWTRLPYGRLKVPTHLFSAGSIFSKNSAGICKSSLDVRVTRVSRSH
jgi:hypothetical protein